MYKTTSQNRQHAVDQRGQWATWASGDLPQLTAHQEADTIRDRLKRITSQLASASGEQRTELIQEKLALESRISHLRKSGLLRQKLDISNYIIDVVRARMSKGEWNAVVQAAERLRKEEEAKSAKPQAT